MRDRCPKDVRGLLRWLRGNHELWRRHSVFTQDRPVSIPPRAPQRICSTTAYARSIDAADTCATTAPARARSRTRYGGHTPTRSPDGVTLPHVTHPAAGRHAVTCPPGQSPGGHARPEDAPVRTPRHSPTGPREPRPLSRPPSAPSPWSAPATASAPTARRPAGRVTAAGVPPAAGVVPSGVAPRVVATTRRGIAPAGPPAGVAAVAAPREPTRPRPSGHRPRRRLRAPPAGVRHEAHHETDADDHHSDSQDHDLVPLLFLVPGRPRRAPPCTRVHEGCPHLRPTKAELRNF